MGLKAVFTCCGRQEKEKDLGNVIAHEGEEKKEKKEKKFKLFRRKSVASYSVTKSDAKTPEDPKLITRITVCFAGMLLI